jgi:ABC-type multidrug transport system fused ATPase/permease subunit
MKAAGIDDHDPISWSRLMRWAWYVVRGSLGLFVLATLVQLLAPLALQYNAQLLTKIVALAPQQDAAPPATAAPAPRNRRKAEHDKSEGNGILGALFPKDLEWAAILFAISAFVLIFALLGDRLFQSWIDAVIAGRLQHQLHDRMLLLGPDYHGKHDFAKRNTIVNGYVVTAQQMLCDIVAFPLVRGVALVTAMLLLIDNFNRITGQPAWVKAALVSGVLVLPLAGWWFARRVLKAAKAVERARHAVNREFMNSCWNPIEINLMGAVRQRVTAFGRSVDAFRHATVRAKVPSELSTQFQAAVPRILAAVFVLFGVFVALRAGDHQVAAAIVGFALIVPLAVQPISELVSFYTSVSGAWPQIDAVISVLEARVEDETLRTETLDGRDPVVALKRVHFKYPRGDKIILDGVTHAFPAGKTSAIVGIKGGGKSTVLNLVMRLLRPQVGEIAIGGVALESVTTDSLRKTLFMVAQFPVFMIDTVRNNFLLAKQDATDPEIEAACKSTGIWDVLKRGAGERNPLDAVLSEEVKLSGGEQKLFAVTRGLLRRPRVLLLDEPTAGLDADAIAELARTLKPVLAGQTVILVDHRMGFVAELADEVCCLEKGKFTAVGTLQEVDRAGTLFNRLKQKERLLGDSLAALKAADQLVPEEAPAALEPAK